MKLIVTQHAVEQYRRRHAPEIDLNVAHADLQSAAAVATPLGRAAYKGDLYCLDSLDCEVVMIDEPGQRVMLTVLPKRAERMTHADHLAAGAELLAASEAADAARAEQARCKVQLQQASQSRQSTRSQPASAAHRLAVEVHVAKQKHVESIRHADAKQLELAILRMEMRLANEQHQQSKNDARRALELAVRALVEYGATSVLAEIQAVHVYFTAPAFYEPKCNTVATGGAA